MAVKVTFVNNDVVHILDDTYLMAWNSLKSNSIEQEYYVSEQLGGSRNDGGVLGTSNQIQGLQGFFGSVDWFSIKTEPDKVYKTSAILSLELNAI